MDEENFLADIPREGENVEEILNSVDKELQEETPAESLPEEVVDLKKNETWKQMREDMEAERQARLDLEERLKGFESKGLREEKEEVNQPAFLTKMIGENEEVAKDWMQEKATIKEQVKQELIQEQIDAQKKETETREYWNKWTQERFNEVEQEFKVSFKTEPTLKNELAKIMNDYTPTDEQGNLDYKKGMKLLTDLKKAQVQAEDQKVQVKKNIADATVSNETQAKGNKGYLTSHDLRGKDFRSLL